MARYDFENFWIRIDYWRIPNFDILKYSFFPDYQLTLDLGCTLQAASREGHDDRFVWCDFSE